MKAACALLLACGLGAVAAAAEPPRDPMQPPAAALPAAPASAASAPAGDAMPRHIVVAGGVRHLVDRGRRLAVGDLLGAARIERIEADAVWLRDAQGLRRVPLYPGVTRRAAIDPLPPASAPRRSPVRSPTDSPTKDVLR